jgi:hypothetical protein
MAFNATSFTYDGINSSDFGLRICEFEAQGKNENTILKATIKSDSLPNSYRKIHYKTIYDEPQSFKVTMMFVGDLDITTKSQIIDWLCGQPNYKKLYIHAPGMEDIYYNCIFDELSEIDINRKCVGFSGTATCDSPFQYMKPEEKTYTLTEATTTIPLLNKSDSTGFYILPKLVFTTDASTTTFSIVNQSDNNREFKFTDISGGETITIDNQAMIITSNTTMSRLVNFNYGWLRFVKGINTLVVTGKGALTISYPVVRKVGFQ